MAILKDYLWVIIPLVIIIFVVYQLFKKRKMVAIEPVETTQQKVELVPWSRVNEIVEQERHRIASELHDELGTLLSVIHLDLELVLREASSLTPHGEARLLEVRKNLSHVIESIRHNIWSLSPQMLDQVSLGFALRELCHKLDAYKGTHLHFVQSGTALSISQKQKLNLFRIVQELLTNAIKHSGAWNISVQLHWDPDKLTLVVEDDGSGYSRTAHEQKTGGMGTSNIIKRANVIGAVLRKEELTRGLRVFIELKVQVSNTTDQTPNKDKDENTLT